MTFCNAPKVIPPGWRLRSSPDGTYISTLTKEGMGVVFSFETFDKEAKDCPPMGPGKYAHISISRNNKYPSWDEMRDYIYDPMNDDWFDRQRDVVMFLPPPEQYVNVHKNCFHFYQKVGK